MWANYSTDQKNCTDHIFNIKLEEKSFKMSFKALPVKILRLKNRQGADRVKHIHLWKYKKCFWIELIFFHFVRFFKQKYIIKLILHRLSLNINFIFRCKCKLTPFDKKTLINLKLMGGITYWFGRSNFCGKGKGRCISPWMKK